MSKSKKITLKKVKKAYFDLELEGKQQFFEFKDFSSKVISDMETTLEAQHEAMRNNTTCTTEGLNEKEQEKIVDELFEWIWENQSPGEWMSEMRELLGNDSRKK